MTLNHQNSSSNCYFFQYSFKKLFRNPDYFVEFQGKFTKYLDFFPVNNQI